MSKKLRSFLPILVVLGLVGITAVLVLRSRPVDYPGIAFSNGRIEAQSIDVATRYGARIQAISVEEGQMVAAGDVLAELDMGDLAASLTGAQANVRASEQKKDAAAATVVQAQAALDLANRELARAERLVKDHAVSESRRDQALNAQQAAAAQLDAAQKTLAGVTESIGVAQAEVARLTDLLADQQLKAPRAARVLYRLVEPGEVVAAGGKVVTLLDLTDVYMSIFLPAEAAGKLHIGAQARIMVDALPGVAIPAFVSYVSPQAQFTPRQVETRTEREKLTFRVKVRVPAVLLQKHMDAVKTGVPGMAYVKVDPNAPWPAFLQGDPQLLKDVEAQP